MVKLESRAIELRAQGLTYAAIAADLGYASESVARRVVKRGLSRYLKHHGAEVVRAQEMARMEMLLGRLWGSLGDHDGAVDVKVAAQIVNASRRIAELAGADADRKAQGVHVDVAVASDYVPQVLRDVEEYMALADELLQSGYGSGRCAELPPGDCDAGHEPLE